MRQNFSVVDEWKRIQDGFRNKQDEWDSASLIRNKVVGSTHDRNMSLRAEEDDRLVGIRGQETF